MQQQQQHKSNHFTKINNAIDALAWHLVLRKAPGYHSDVMVVWCISARNRYESGYLSVSACPVQTQIVVFHCPPCLLQDFCCTHLNIFKYGLTALIVVFHCSACLLQDLCNLLYLSQTMLLKVEPGFQLLVCFLSSLPQYCTCIGPVWSSTVLVSAIRY